MKDKYNYCLTTEKYSFKSEAKAQRRLNKYKDIKRIYLCEHCNGWHLTSMGVGLAVKEGLIEKPKKKNKLTPKDIQKRIDELKCKNG